MNVVLERATLTLVHRILVVHALSREPIPQITATVTQPLPVGWTLDVRGAEVLVSRWAHAPDLDAVPDVAIAVTDPELKVRLASPQATVTLAARDITHQFTPAPAVLEVELVDENGDPSSGRTVRARPSAGTSMQLPEQGTTGVYASPPRVWTAAFHPLQVRVGSATAARVAIDVRRRITRVRVVDPT